MQQNIIPVKMQHNLVLMQHNHVLMHQNLVLMRQNLVLMQQNLVPDNMQQNLILDIILSYLKDGTKSGSR